MPPPGSTDSKRIYGRLLLAALVGLGATTAHLHAQVAVVFSPLSPRQPVTPAPYAIFAATAPLADNSATLSTSWAGRRPMPLDPGSLEQ